MTKQQIQVLTFMRSFEQHMEVYPNIPPTDEQTLRKLLVIEECAELTDAINAGNIVEIAKEAADVMYVVLGLANCYGFDLEPVFDEVHRSNMTKVGGHKNKLGKWVKPATYERADITPLEPWKG